MLDKLLIPTPNVSIMIGITITANDIRTECARCFPAAIGFLSFQL